MEHLIHIPWHEVLLPKPSWAEKLIRPVVIYLALLLIFRVASKRELAQATLFDFLIILLISNVVQNAIIGDDNSILGAIAGAVMLVVLSAFLNRITGRSHKARALLEGNPVLLVHNGTVLEDAMRRETVTRYDLFSNIRKAGLVHLNDVGYAVLELDGTISIIRKEDKKHPLNCLPPEILAAIGEDPGVSEAHEDKDKRPSGQPDSALRRTPAERAHEP
jgi:uncharacterized membrane protein YcaP (DUF421 family)